MKWGPSSICQFARDAGFPWRVVAPAAAIALASSGGHDNYDMAAGIPGAGHWKGLWAIDIDRWPDYAALDLADPETAAQAAARLCLAVGSFRWSPAFCSGQYRHWLGITVPAMSLPARIEPVHAPVALWVHEQVGTNRVSPQRSLTRG